MAFKTKVDTGNGELFKFEKNGQSIEGYFVGSFDYQGDYAPTKKHIFQTDKGLVTVIGQAHLIQMLEGLTPGILVRVTLVGSKKTNKGKPMKLFELQYDEDQVIDIGDVVNSAQAPNEEEGQEEEEQQEEEAQEEEQQPLPRAARPAPAPAARASAGAAPKSTVSPEQKARAAALLGKR